MVSSGAGAPRLVLVKTGIVADAHGNDVALRAVLKDASRFGADCWRALGDLVLFGPRPAEVLELLHGLPGTEDTGPLPLTVAPPRRPGSG